MGRSPSLVVSYLEASPQGIPPMTQGMPMGRVF